jgi:hypothetical protein
MCEIEGHHLTSAAIIGHDGTVWAQSAAFPPVSASDPPAYRRPLFFFSVDGRSDRSITALTRGS